MSDSARFVFLLSVLFLASCGEKATDSTSQGSGPTVESACETDSTDQAPRMDQEAWRNDYGATHTPRWESGKPHLKMIVHALRDAPSYYESGGMRGVADFHMERLKQILDAPQTIADKKVISGSLISNAKRGTFGYCGVILNVPVENIIATFPTDIGSTRRFANSESDEENFRIIREKLGILSPQELLCRTRPGDYNEILLRGTSTAQDRVSVIGLFAKSSFGKPLCSAKMLEMLTTSAVRNGIPLVQIPE